jgi:hypothetical protein
MRRPRYLQTLQNDLEFLIIAPTAAPTSLDNLQPFNLSTELIAVQALLHSTRLNPTRRPPPEAYLDYDLSFFQIIKDFPVEAFVAQFGVEGLTVLPRGTRFAATLGADVFGDTSGEYHIGHRLDAAELLMRRATRMARNSRVNSSISVIRLSLRPSWVCASTIRQA